MSENQKSYNDFDEEIVTENDKSDVNRARIQNTFFPNIKRTIKLAE